MVEAVPTDVMEAAQAAGQDHVFKDWESLSSEQQASLLKDVQVDLQAWLHHALLKLGCRRCQWRLRTI